MASFLSHKLALLILSLLILPLHAAESVSGAEPAFKKESVLTNEPPTVLTRQSADPITADAVLNSDKTLNQSTSVLPNYQEPFSSQALLQLVLGLVVVVALILVCSWLLRRFSGMAPIAKNMRVVSVLPLSAREKVVLVNVGDKQILLGVAPGRVSHLESFDEPVVTAEMQPSGFAKRLSEAVKKQQVESHD